MFAIHLCFFPQLTTLPQQTYHIDFPNLSILINSLVNLAVKLAFV